MGSRGFWVRMPTRELFKNLINYVPPGTEMTAKEKYAERMKKLRDLHGKRNEARKLNHQEVRSAWWWEGLVPILHYVT